MALTTLKNEIGPFKLALADLANMSKKGCADLEKAYKALDNARKKSGASSSSPSAMVALPILEYGIAMASAARQVSIAGWSAVDSLPLPVLFTGINNANHKITEAAGIVFSSAVSPFITKFSGASNGRAERNFKGDALAECQKFLGEVVLLPSTLAQAQMQQDMQVACFGVAKGGCTVNVEKGRCATLRVHFRGTKQMLMANGAEYRCWLNSNSIRRLVIPTTDPGPQI